ncbi:uncharacterized protein LOC123512655 isoform X2 [Portunus trituberculatus]|uniref:uncharacterized protein LOC123512655 isoform X2 n=1 Tax=Portunus trituberculatus TaxID=210409 RepID=UPI001E1CFF4B|nr:uncharacterized protein LOC123512655 isoform X2 [Portunus trituberculatus]
MRHSVQLMQELSSTLNHSYHSLPDGSKKVLEVFHRRMETRKREGVTCTTETQVHKALSISTMKNNAARPGSPEVDDVREVEEPQTAATTLPPEVEIRVQLFDGQVIHITSSPLEEAGPGGGDDKKTCESEVKRDSRSGVLNGEVVGTLSGGTMTLLTSNGKTYILPQHLAAAEGGSYLISGEVLNTEEVLQATDVLHDEQMLTISPPPPQSAMDFTSVAGHPDALAIATSEVFSEDYVSLPLHTQGHLTEQSRTFRFKTMDVENPQEVHNKMYTQSRSDSQMRNLLIPDASIITINASDAASSDECTERDSKRTVRKNSDSETVTKEKGNVEALHCKPKEGKDGSDRVSQIQLDPSKLVGLSNNASSKKYTTTRASEEMRTKEVRVGEACVAKTTSEERNERTQPVNSDFVPKSSAQTDAQNLRLRRSSRIRRVKRITDEEESELTEESCTGKRRKGVKGEVPAALWECGSCDAMFRTKVGRNRHMKEGHAFTCYVCGWEGHSKTKYEIHISTVHCNQQARCLACRKDFPGYEAYKQHMKEMHSTSIVTSTSTSTSSSVVTNSTTTTTTTTTTAAATTTATSSAAVAIKTEVESDARLEEQIKKEDQSDVVMEEKHDPGSSDFKEMNSCSDQSCPYCSKTFTRRSRLRRHLNYHLGNRTFMCKICTKCFVEKSGLDAHLLTHCPVNKECSQCGKVFKTERTMTRHLRTHLNMTYTCNICNKQFRHEESLRVHKSVHKEGGSGNVCNVCEKDCKTPHYLQLHMSTKHEVAKFMCEQCNRSFKWKQSYRKHMAIHHGDGYLKFKCNFCPRYFMTTSELRLHQVVHSTEKKHLCDICGKAFKHEYTRDKHTKTVHREDREHMCPQCGTLFKAKAYLDQHLAHVHTTKERVVCKYCGNDFKTDANLRSHIKVVHKQRSPKYSCKTCHKMFLAPKDLLRHSKVHTGVKDYVCPRCHRCFSRKDNMIAHLRTHTVPHQAPNPVLESEVVVMDAVMPQADHQAPPPQEVPHILGLPSSIAPEIPPVSSSNIILSSVPTTSGNIALSEFSPANNIVLSGESSSQTTALASSPASSCVTTITDTPVTPHRISISGLPVPSMADITSMPPSSTGSIIFSTVPVSSFNVSSVSSSSSSTVVSRGSLSGTLACSTSNSMSGSSISSSSSNSSVTNPLASSSILNLSPSNSLGACTTHPNHQTYSFHPQLVVSSPNQVSNISSLITASPVPSNVISLPKSHSTSGPVFVSQSSHTQVMCSTLQGEQVVLTAGSLAPISKVSIQDGNSPQYMRLDPLSASVCPTPSSINPLSPSVSSSERNPGGTLAEDMPLSTDSTPHASSVDVPDSVESNIILPTSSILQEAALILPEKSGLYTIMGGGGKITPLETLTLHSVPPPSSHSD